MYKGIIQKIKPSFTEEYILRDNRFDGEVENPIDTSLIPNITISTTALNADWNGEWRTKTQPDYQLQYSDGVPIKFYKIWDELPSDLKKKDDETQSDWEARLYDRLWDGLYTIKYFSGLDFSSIYESCSETEYQAKTDKDTTKVYGTSDTYENRNAYYHIYFDNVWHDYTTETQLQEIFDKIYELYPDVFKGVSEMSINSIKKNLYGIIEDFYPLIGSSSTLEEYTTQLYNEGKENFKFMTDDEGKTFYTSLTLLGGLINCAFVEVKEDTTFLGMFPLTKGWYCGVAGEYSIDSQIDFFETSFCQLSTIKQLDEDLLPLSLTKSVNELILKSKETTLTLSLGLSVEVTAMSDTEYNLYLLNEDGSFSSKKADWYKLNTYWKNGYNFKIGNTRATILGMELVSKYSYTLLNLLNDEYNSLARNIYSPLQFLIGVRDENSLNLLTLTVPLGYGQDDWDSYSSNSSFGPDSDKEHVGTVYKNTTPSTNGNDYFLTPYYNEEGEYVWYSFAERCGGLKTKYAQIQITEKDLPFRIEQPSKAILGLPNGTHAADIENSNSTLIYYEGNYPIVKIGKGTERSITQSFSDYLWTEYNIFPFSKFDIDMGPGTFGFQQISGSNNYKLYQLRSLKGTIFPQSPDGWTVVSSTDETFEVGGGLYSFSNTGLTMPTAGFVNCIDSSTTAPTENGTGYFNTKGIYIIQDGATKRVDSLQATYYPYSFYYWTETVLEDNSLRKTKKTVTMTYNIDGDRGKQNYSTTSTSVDYAALPTAKYLEVGTSYNLVAKKATLSSDVTYEWVKQE